MSKVLPNVRVTGAVVVAVRSSPVFFPLFFLCRRAFPAGGGVLSSGGSAGLAGCCRWCGGRVLLRRGEGAVGVWDGFFGVCGRVLLGVGKGPVGAAEGFRRALGRVPLRLRKCSFGGWGGFRRGCGRVVWSRWKGSVGLAEGLFGGGVAVAIRFLCAVYDVPAALVRAEVKEKLHKEKEDDDEGHYSDDGL